MFHNIDSFLKAFWRVIRNVFSNFLQLSGSDMRTGASSPEAISDRSREGCRLALHVLIRVTRVLEDLTSDSTNLPILKFLNR